MLMCAVLKCKIYGKGKGLASGEDQDQCGTPRPRLAPHNGLKVLSFLVPFDHDRKIMWQQGLFSTELNTYACLGMKLKKIPEVAVTADS